MLCGGVHWGTSIFLGLFLPAFFLQFLFAWIVYGRSARPPALFPRWYFHRGRPQDKEEIRNLRARAPARPRARAREQLCVERELIQIRERCPPTSTCTSLHRTAPTLKTCFSLIPRIHASLQCLFAGAEGGVKSRRSQSFGGKKPKALKPLTPNPKALSRGVAFLQPKTRDSIPPQTTYPFPLRGPPAEALPVFSHPYAYPSTPPSPKCSAAMSVPGVFRAPRAVRLFLMGSAWGLGRGRARARTHTHQFIAKMR